VHGLDFAKDSAGATVQWRALRAGPLSHGWVPHAWKPPGRQHSAKNGHRHGKTARLDYHNALALTQTLRASPPSAHLESLHRYVRRGGVAMGQLGWGGLVPVKVPRLHLPHKHRHAPKTYKK
jgi:hypothetical protein